MVDLMALLLFRVPVRGSAAAFGGGRAIVCRREYRLWPLALDLR